jgi:hypothetical protein
MDDPQPGNDDLKLEGVGATDVLAKRQQVDGGEGNQE